jgi:choloylglycine hydrolase
MCFRKSCFQSLFRALAAALCIYVGFTHEALGCSDVVANGGREGNLTVSGRTLDYDAEYPSSIVYVPGRLNWDSTMPDLSKATHWIGRYGFIGISLPGDIKHYLDGMNEKGLSAALLWQRDAEFQEPGAPDFTLSNVDLVSWALSNNSNVSGVLRDLKDMAVWHNGMLLPRPVHLVLHDAEGQSAVVEWIKGEMTVHTGKEYKDVTTNEPDYKEQVRYLSRFEDKLTNQDVKDTKLDVWIEGAGMLGMAADSMSKTRFVRLHTLNKYALQNFDDWHIYTSPMYGSDWSVQTVFQLLGRVAIPRGTIMRNDPASGVVYPYTLWSMVRDHNRKRLYLRGYRNQIIRMVDLTKIDFSRSEIQEITPVEPAATEETDALDVTYLPIGKLSLDPRRKLVSVRVQLTIRPEDVGSTGDMYIFAKRRSGEYSYWTGRKWKKAAGMQIKPCRRSSALKTVRLCVIKKEPVRRWARTAIYAGYGSNVTDMFISGQFHQVAYIQ